MGKEFRPILAVNAEIDKIVYPVLASCKIDGVRCLIKDGKPLTRTLKEIPNICVRNELVRLFSDTPGLVDGELIVGKTFQETSSAVMSFEGEPDFRYCVFDYVESDFEKPFKDRLLDMHKLLERIGSHQIVGVLSEPIENYTQLQKCEEFWLSEGYEGLCFRSFDSRYKFGRSTVKEGILLKLKRFTDSEATVIGFQELMHNENEAKKDALGHTDRATCKENMVGMNTLGSLQVRDVVSGVEFSLGTGFNAEQRKSIWDNQYTYVGQLVKYKYQASGVKDLPRFPVFLGFRDKDDL
jgi:DNA ligase-1